MVNTKEEKLELVYKAIDAIMNLSEIPEADMHYFVHSVNGVVDNLRKLESKIEE